MCVSLQNDPSSAVIVHIPYPHYIPSWILGKPIHRFHNKAGDLISKWHSVDHISQILNRSFKKAVIVVQERSASSAGFENGRRSKFN